MQLSVKAVMHIHRGIEVGMALVVTIGAQKEFAPRPLMHWLLWDVNLTPLWPQREQYCEVP
jgi:hypothetical protein